MLNVILYDEMKMKLALEYGKEMSTIIFSFSNNKNYLTSKAMFRKRRKFFLSLSKF